MCAPREERIEVLIETFLRKQMGLKAHTVTKMEETDQCMIVHIDRLGRRLLRCGLCRQRCRKVHSLRKPRMWNDLSMRKLPLKLSYRPRRVECPRCGVRVEDFPWAEPWARVTTALSHAVARLARTVVYDLERRVLLWVGDGRSEDEVRPFFAKEMGARRCHTLLEGEIQQILTDLDLRDRVLVEKDH